MLSYQRNTKASTKITIHSTKSQPLKKMTRKKERLNSSFTRLRHLDLLSKTGFLSNTIINIKLKNYEQKVFYVGSCVAGIRR